MAVGYDRDSFTGEDYIIIKNSWGPMWGEGGYARISMTDKYGRNGICGIFHEGFYALIWFIVFNLQINLAFYIF